MVEDQGSLEIVGDTNRWYFKNGTTPASAFTPMLTLDNANGNVGIGTTGPGAKLDIVGGVFKISSSDGTETNANRFFSIGAHDVDGVIRMNPGPESTIYINREVGTTRDLHVMDGNANTILFTQGSTQRVGIGTTVPQAKLAVAGNIMAYEGNKIGFRYSAEDPGPYSYLTSTGPAGGPFGLQFHSVGTIHSDTAKLYSFFTNGGGGPDTETFTIQSNGNVGIGATANLKPLTIFRSTDNDYQIYIRQPDQTDSQTAGFYFGADNAGDLSIAYDNNVAKFKRLLIDGDGDRVLVPTGPVGIGFYPGAGYKLDVAGKIHATDTISADSDARFKQDPQPLTAVLPKLAQLHSLSYTPSPLGQARGMAPGRELGVLGQELEQVFPELVSTSGPEQYRSVDYSRLSVVLLEAVKELERKNDNLNSEVASLKQQNNALQGRLELLEKAR